MKNIKIRPVKTNLKVGDTVKIISGAHKGIEAKITHILTHEHQATLEGINLRTRHYRSTAYSPAHKAKVQMGIDLSNLKLLKASTEIRKSTKSTSKTKPTAKLKSAKQEQTS